MNGAVIFAITFASFTVLAMIVSIGINAIENFFSTPAHSPRSSSAHFACVDREEESNNA